MFTQSSKLILLNACNNFGQLAADGNSRCVCISDGSLLPVMAAKFGFEKVKLFYEVKYY